MGGHHQDNPTPCAGGKARFAPTRWTIVLAAAEGQSATHARRALEELAQTYWFPLYAYIRRVGHRSPEAEDLTQEFFAHLIEKQSLASADRTKGRFRSFLLTSVKNFLANEWDKTHAKKRGGGARLISLDALDAEARYTIEPVDNMTPERIFEQRWARAILDRVLARLRQRYEQKHRARLFDVLKSALVSHGDETSHAAMATQLEMSSSALAVAVHRLRRRYRDLLRDEIAQTVASPELVEEEINYLLHCL